MLLKGSLVAILHLLLHTLFSFELVQGSVQNKSVHQSNSHRQKRLFSLFNIVQFQISAKSVYFESGRSGILAGQINIVQGTGVNSDRRYNIKVSYIECTSIVR
ncbi:hypothetical protein TCAL_16142 [Tigriopus californicus]|uniref:Secreted protein n=1 Tax=Tigriopus californicus TaxID=6832 RepID=A0A553P1V6_TIGCA|nr:hypothetical protein TCAL_16142 [Tigriopus californicus]